MNSDASLRDLPPGDPKLTARILSHLKSRGLFDELRRDCLGDVDTKPAYLNLKQRVDGYITKFLSAQTWTPDMNKNHVRDVMRREINESGMLSAGMDHLVDQIINPKIYHVFTPEVENGVRQFFGLDRPETATPQQVSALQPSETRLPELLTSGDNVSNMAVSAAAPGPDLSIDENAQDVTRAPSPRGYPRPPSPSDIVSDVSSEPQLMIVTESNDRLEEEDEDSIPAPSPEMEVATALVLKEDVSEKISVLDPAEPSKEVALPPVAEVDAWEKPQKNVEDKTQKPAEEREKEKTPKRQDDHKADKARKDKKVERDKRTDKEKHRAESQPSKSDSKSKVHSSSQKNSDSSSKSSKTHKPRTDANASKDRKDGTDSLAGKGDLREKETKSRVESSRDDATSSREKGESSRTEPSRERGKHGTSSSSKSGRGKDADAKSSGRTSFDRHRSHDSQHHHDRKQHGNRHSGEEEKSKDGHKSRSSESRHSSEKPRSSTKDSSKPHKSSSKSSRRPSESSRGSRKEKSHNKKNAEHKTEREEAVNAEPKVVSEQNSPSFASWDGREATIEGGEILRFSYVRDKSSGSCEGDLKLVSATCTLPGLGRGSASGSDDGLGFGNAVGAELEQGEASQVYTPQEETPIEPEKCTEPKNEADNLTSGEPRGEKERKSHKRRKADVSPRIGKRSPEKKRQKRGEKDGNESDEAWSDVTVSSVHTSDLSSYDDRISLSSTEEVQEDEDSGAKGKWKIPLKEIKKIASISSSNEDDDRLSKSEPEPESKQPEQAIQNPATEPPANEKAPLLFSSPGTSCSQDNADGVPEGKMGLRRQRKINPKYVSEEFSSIFTEGKKPAAGTIDFSELAKYGKERHHDDRPRRVHPEPKAGHEPRRQQTPREEPFPFPPSDLSDHGEPEIFPLEEGGLEPRKPSRRLSGSAKSTSPDAPEGRHRSESTSSKRYESSDLYKPRPVISSGTRRSRSGIQAPASPTTEEETEEEQSVKRKKHRPLKICIGYKRASRPPAGAAPGKRKRV